MKPRTNYLLIGLFVVVGTALAVVAVIGLIWLWVASVPMQSSEQVSFVHLRFPIIMTALPVATAGVAVSDAPLSAGLPWSVAVAP